MKQNLTLFNPAIFSLLEHGFCSESEDVKAKQVKKLDANNDNVRKNLVKPRG